MGSRAIRLGVNVDHVATVRQARGTSYPSVVEAALAAEAGGAEGITVHLREDRRHIQDHDVISLREAVATKLNLELACSNEVLDIACRVKPQDACIVPERREELTTEGGLSVDGNQERVGDAVARLAAAGIAVSLFIDPDEREIEAAVAVGAPVIEIHTGAYADARDETDRRIELERIRHAASFAHERGLQVNAGHGLTVANVEPIASIPEIVELNIGHSIVARSIMIGIEAATREMLGACYSARSAAAASG